MPDPSDLLAMLIFSIVGLIAFKSGKREFNIPRLTLGMILMIFPYAVPNGLWLWVTGIILTSLLYKFREA